MFNRERIQRFKFAAVGSGEFEISNRFLMVTLVLGVECRSSIRQ